MNYPLAKKEYNKSMFAYNAGVIFYLTGSFTCGFVIGYTIGTLLSGKRLDGSLAIAGGSGLTSIIIGGALGRIGTNHYFKAINEYNSKISKKDISNLYLQYSADGLGMAYKF
jgi:hypothetical protein